MARKPCANSSLRFATRTISKGSTLPFPLDNQHPRELRKILELAATRAIKEQAPGVTPSDPYRKPRRLHY
jgi:hypothetical protein